MTNRLRVFWLFSCLTSLAAVSCGTPKPSAEAPAQVAQMEVHVAAAANLRAVLDDIARSFLAKSGIDVISTIGPTAQLAQQIENGAPIDVFLSADTQHVEDLIARHAADASSRAIYARGRLVLWAPARPDIATLRDLARPDVHQVGCARPELAPYGAATIEALKKSGLWPQVEPKLVYGQSISAAKQYADSGNTAAAFTALSLVINSGGHYVLIDENLHAPLDQALCIIKTNPAAVRFREFLLGPEGAAILSKSGYSRP